MSGEPDGERLRRLEARIAEARASAEPRRRSHQEEHYSQAQVAWRMVIELVAGLGVGFGIGLGLDGLLGTAPWFMILFIFLGLAAGVQVMLRTAKEVQVSKRAPYVEDLAQPRHDGEAQSVEALGRRSGPAVPGPAMDGPGAAVGDGEVGVSGAADRPGPSEGPAGR